jgi:osmotically-inducible protein OsmY
MVEGRDIGTVVRMPRDHPTQRLTHLVIRRGILSPSLRIVPVDRVVEATSEHLVLDLRFDDLAALPEYRPDDQIAADVEWALGNDEIIRRLSQPYLAVTVRDGVVAVTGNVASSAHRPRIAEAVATVRGVLGLQNLPIGDDELETAVAQALGRDARIRRCIIPVHATLGVIRLSGEVPAGATELARAVPGVRGVRTADPGARAVWS